MNRVTLCVVVTVLAAGSVSIGQQPKQNSQHASAEEASPSFEVATIKPNPSGVHGLIQGLTITGRTLRLRNASVLDLIGFAFNVQPRQVVNAPGWANDDRYDLEGIADRDGTLSRQQVEGMLQKLLTGRFRLKYHEDKREMSAFVLEDGKNGSKLPETTRSGPLPQFSMRPEPTGLTVHVVNARLGDFTSFLQMVVLDRPVVNATGLTGRYDFDVTFTPDDSQFGGHPPKSSEQSDIASVAPNLFEAVQQQIGLRIRAERTAVPVIVIDHVDRPSPN